MFSADTFEDNKINNGLKTEFLKHSYIKHRMPWENESERPTKIRR